MDNFYSALGNAIHQAISATLFSFYKVPYCSSTIKNEFLWKNLVLMEGHLSGLITWLATSQ